MNLSAPVLATIPSPTQSVWYLGPLPVRAYALCILMGILVAVQLGERRWVQRGGRPGAVLDIAVWAVPFGIIGGRVYHVATSWQPYFGAGGDPVRALYIWEGGLGIWGAISLGGLGAWIGARRAGIRLPPMADALAPGIVLAQAIGRWGNWFNNELYGEKTSLPWGLQIHQWDQAAGHAVLGPDGKPVVAGVFQPTFLYESLWDAGVAGAIIWADRRWRLGHGRVFALYVLLYTLGRGWIEYLRIDDANHILGLRLNLWTSMIVGLGALIALVLSARFRPGRETTLTRPPGRPFARIIRRDEDDDRDQAAGAAGAGKPAAAGDASAEDPLAVDPVDVDPVDEDPVADDEVAEGGKDSGAKPAAAAKPTAAAKPSAEGKPSAEDKASAESKPAAEGKRADGEPAEGEPAEAGAAGTKDR